MAPYHFCTGFNRYWFETELGKHGAVILECESNGDFYGWVRQEVLRMPFVTQKYFGKADIGLKLACAMFAHRLKRYIRKSNNSGELLCFGYMVVAKKVSF